MSQLFLDPTNIPTGCKNFQHVPATLPQSVRALGHLPDINQLLPGDLILISPITPSFVQKQIQRVQTKGGYHGDDARWTHSAVYLGSDFSTCDATGKGIRHNSLLDVISNHRIRVRREPTLETNYRWRIALSATLQLGTSYGIRSALTIWVRSIQGFHAPQNTATRSRSSIICSELYADSFLMATGSTLQWNHPGKDVSPALLSYVPELVDIATGWLKIPA